MHIWCKMQIIYPKMTYEQLILEKTKSKDMVKHVIAWFLTKNINSMVNLMKLISLHSVAQQMQICKFLLSKYLFPARIHKEITRKC